jgi:ADP-ribose pyrophosphatase YjhB (NUDIX family)
MVDRSYPKLPVVAVSAAVMESGRLLLVKRGGEPGKGLWSLPGGVLELGETLHDGLVREVREETGLLVDPGPLLGVFEHMVRDGEDRVTYHYILIDYLARPSGGRLAAGSDAPEAVWIPLDQARAYPLTPETGRVLELLRERGHALG